MPPMLQWVQLCSEKLLFTISRIAPIQVTRIGFGDEQFIWAVVVSGYDAGSKIDKKFLVVLYFLLSINEIE
jgi:hypothetical protein